jgi:TolA-binding protein
MNCSDVEQASIIERYLHAQLSDAEREAWESHYFECDRCFAALEALTAVRDAVRIAGPPPVPVRQPRHWAWPVFGLAATAAAAALLLFIVPGMREKKAAPIQAASPAAPPVVVASLEPPRYVAQTFRGASDVAGRKFRDAMQGYGRGDYAATADALRAVLAQYPDSIEARHFLGICLLMQGQAEASIGELRRVADVGDRSPYQEEAVYYLAQALARTNRFAEARTDATRVIEMHGDYAARAQSLLSSLP